MRASIIWFPSLILFQESNSPSTAALFLSLAFASSRSIDLHSQKVSFATEESEADIRDKKQIVLSTVLHQRLTKFGIG